ncbi:hypothetical protein FDECE_10100 [Fusarium decemcellulare]|nr:hypothetical protein FDECE_10100 [Fusarium decemcellulare]
MFVDPTTLSYAAFGLISILLGGKGTAHYFLGTSTAATTTSSSGKLLKAQLTEEQQARQHVCDAYALFKAHHPGDTEPPDFYTYLDVPTDASRADILSGLYKRNGDLLHQQDALYDSDGQISEIDRQRQATIDLNIAIAHVLTSGQEKSLYDGVFYPLVSGGALLKTKWNLVDKECRAKRG